MTPDSCLATMPQPSLGPAPLASPLPAMGRGAAAVAAGACADTVAGARAGARADIAAGAVRLGSGEPLVPEELLTPPFREESRGLLRDLAALQLDRHLRRLARMRNPVDLRLGRLLSRLDRMSGCLALGFARLADYAAERLGLPARRARALIALARGLEPLPVLAAAFEAGDISRSQARLLLRVATPDDEAAWLARARALNVRRLDREIRAALAGADGADAASTGATSTDAASGDAACTDAASTPEPAEFTDDGAATDDEDAPQGEWLAVAVPRRLRAIWDRALELARRCSGAPDPVWGCVEMIAADFLSGVPDLASILAREPTEPGDAPGAAGGPDWDAAPTDDDAHRRSAYQEDTDLFEEVLRALEADTSARGWVPAAEGLTVLVPDSTEPRPDDSPRTIDRRLRELVRLRQSITWHQGRLLRLFVDRRLYRELGFLSFSRYCRERAGLGVRRAWDLVALERRLWMLPRVTTAYRSGTLSWVRAALIARVATEWTEEAWLRLAESVTVRRLEEEVALVQRDDGPPSYGRGAPAGVDSDGRVQMLAPSSAGRRDLPHDPDAEPDVDPDSEHRPQSHLRSIPPGVQMSDVSDGWTRLRFWAPHDVAALWKQSVRVARALLSEGGRVQTLALGDEHEIGVDGHAAADSPADDRPADDPPAADPPPDWQCIETILTAFLQSWSVRTDPTWQRNHRIFERDGWRCRVPGCTSRRNLQVHHVVFRSTGGGSEDFNLAVICAAHHLQGIHQGRLRCHLLPGGLLAWEFAPDDGNGDGPLARFVEDVEWSAARASLASLASAASPGCLAGLPPGRDAAPRIAL